MEKSTSIALFVIIVIVVLSGAVGGIWFVLTGASIADVGNESFVDIPSAGEILLLDTIADLKDQQETLKTEIESEYDKAKDIFTSILEEKKITPPDTTTGLDEDMITYESCPSLIRSADDDVDDAKDREKDKERDLRKEEDRLDLLREELVQARNSNSTQSTIERIEDRIRDQEDEVDDAEDELDEAEDETYLARERLDSVQDMCDELRQKLSRKIVGTSHLTKDTCDIEIERIHDFIDDIDDEIDDAERDVDRAEDDLRDAEAKLAAARINSTQASIDRAEERVEDIRDDLDDAEDDLDRQQDRLDDAREELRIIRQKCKDLR
ncbi:MAG: hypothetical protein KAT43_06025 [Nanoarchaeota archaeon]|nr:hypothetical protein [Nanoarchaeota archaeon]